MILVNKQVWDKNYFNYGMPPLMGAEVSHLSKEPPAWKYSRCISQYDL